MDQAVNDPFVHAYRRDGLGVLPCRLPPPLVGELRSALDQVIALNGPEPRDVYRNPHLPWRDGSRHGVRGGGEVFFRVAVLPEILDQVEKVIGPDIILWATTVFAKPARSGKEVPWHQDGHYWPIEPLAACTLWLAIDDVDTENGCMRYLPGSHQRGLLPHFGDENDALSLNERLNQDAFDEATARDDVLAAGQMSLHDVQLVHGSMPNVSNRRRAGLTVRYVPATSYFDRQRKPKVVAEEVDYLNRPIWLVRGQNREPRNDFSPGRAGLEALDRLV